MYPDAKVLLNVRSAESCYANKEKTILKVLKASTDPDSVGSKLIGQGVFDGRLDDRAHIIALFEKDPAAVQAAFGGERLLTYTIGDGREPLCRFLGQPVPDTPFPRTNSADEFHAAVAQAAKSC